MRTSAEANSQGESGPRISHWFCAIGVREGILVDVDVDVAVEVGTEGRGPEARLTLAGSSTGVVDEEDGSDKSESTLGSGDGELTAEEDAANNRPVT